jgi:hypothetical protein
VILYLAAIYTTGISLHGAPFRRMNKREQEVRTGIQHILESYHYVHSDRAVQMMRRDGITVFLDSGAFSAYTQKVEINLDKYCEYIRMNADVIRVASVLDGIGDALKTYKNQQAMEANGVKVLPCFHYGEDERYLEHYIANYPYITLGGMVPINKEQLKYWLDRIWDKYLTNKDGMPKLKVHGFGLTRISLMERYPWYSIDSSSWVQTAMNGGIMVPGFGTVPISSQSPAAKEQGRHFLTYSPIEQERILVEINNRGFDLDRLKAQYDSRYTFNMLTYSELTDPNAIPKPFKIKQETFF